MRLAHAAPRAATSLAALSLAALPLLLAGCAARGAGDGPSPRAREPGPGAGSGAEYYAMELPMTLPFSAAVRVGHVLYLSGQLGTDGSGRLVPGGIGPETRQAMENIRRVVERGGSSMRRVVKCTAMLADMREWAQMNEAYAAFFPDHPPARSAFGVAGLALGARVEIECLATVP
jgi:reactive intermediate/imine deaminase